MVTKRQLGILATAVGLFTVAGIVGIDIAGAGQWSGFGPLQQIGVSLGALAIVTGVILISMGNRPA